MNFIRQTSHFFPINRFLKSSKTYAHVFWPKPNAEHALVIQIELDDALPPTGPVEVLYCAETKKMTIVAKHATAPLGDTQPVAAPEETDGVLESHFCRGQSRFASM